MLGCPGDTPHASGLLGPHLLTDSREPWLLGEKVSQHISVSKAVITYESPSHFLSCAA